MGNTLFRKLTAKGFSPKHVAEVGVYLPETSNLYGYIIAGVRSTLVEPNPVAIAAINESFGGRANVALHAVAVCGEPGTLELIRRGASTYGATIEQSPAVVNDRYQPKDSDRFRVEAVTFDQIDDGSIDLLCVDIEGGEWFVLKHMRSRPAVIALETHGGLYRNPHMPEITGWMRANGYELWYKDKSDSVYVCRDTLSVTAADRLRLVAIDSQLALTRLRKRLKRRFGRGHAYRKPP